MRSNTYHKPSPLGMVLFMVLAMAVVFKHTVITKTILLFADVVIAIAVMVVIALVIKYVTGGGVSNE